MSRLPVHITRLPANKLRNMSAPVAEFTTRGP
jgi:hypothetical protein